MAGSDGGSVTQKLTTVSGGPVCCSNGSKVKAKLPKLPAELVKIYACSYTEKREKRRKISFAYRSRYPMCDCKCMCQPAELVLLLLLMLLL